MDEQLTTPPERSVSPPADPAGRLVEVIPRPLVVVLAIISFLAVSGILIGSWQKPSYLGEPNTRFIMCLGVSVYLAVFLFVLFPQNISISKIPVVNIGAQVAGPVALWMIMLVFLLRLLPPLTGHYLTAVYLDRPTSISAEDVEVAPVKPRTCAVYKVEDKDGNFVGLYVSTPTVSSACQAKITTQIGMCANVSLPLDGSSDTFTIGWGSEPDCGPSHKGGAQ